MEEITIREIFHTIYKWRKQVVISFLLIFSFSFLLQYLPSSEKKIFRATAVIRISQTSYFPVILRDIGMDIKPIKFDIKYEALKAKSEENLREALKILGWIKGEDEENNEVNSGDAISGEYRDEQEEIGTHQKNRKMLGESSSAFLKNFGFVDVLDKSRQLNSVEKDFIVKQKRENRFASVQSYEEEGEEEELINKLRKMIEVSVGKNNTIYISAYSRDPHEAKDVANAVALAYVRNSKKWFSKNIDNALKFLRESFREISGKLISSYSQLSEFAEKTGVIDPKYQFSTETERITELRKKLYETGLKISMIENLFQELSRDPELTAKRMQRIETILMKDGLPEGEEAVEELKRNMSKILAIDRRMLENYKKFTQLEKKERELLKDVHPNHPMIKNIRKEKVELFERILDDLKVLLVELKIREKMLMKEIKEAKENIVHIARNISEYLYIRNDIELLNRIFESYYSTFAELKIASGMWMSFAEIQRKATLPRSPVKKLNIFIIFSLITGIIGGIITAFLFESIDTRFRTIEEIPQTTNTKIAGIILLHKDTKKKQLSEDGILIADDNHPKLYEEIRAMRINLQIHKGKKIKILVVSSLQNEGKTFISLNLGLSFKEVEERTLLFDLNLRHPALSSFLKVPDDKNFIFALSGDKDIDEVIYRSELGIDVVGIPFKYPVQPDVLMSERFSEFLDKLGEKFDVIVADSSPLIVADILPSVKQFDIVLVVYDIKNTPKKVLRNTIDLLRTSGAKDIKIVVNKLTKEFAPDLPNHRYSYYYNKYYKKKNNDKEGRKNKNTEDE